MKYILVAVSALFLLGGCTSANKKADNAQPAQQQPQIVDEEFDLLVAPEYDYESDVAYADQLKNDQAEPAAAAGVKPAKKPVAVKQ